MNEKILNRIFSFISFHFAKKNIMSASEREREREKVRERERERERERDFGLIPKK